MGIESALQTTLYTYLNAQLSESVYDYISTSIDPPYIVVGDTTCNEFDTDGTTGFDMTATIHSFAGGSAYRGRGKVKEIMGNIYNALHRAVLTVTGYDFIGCDYINSNQVVEGDGITFHGIQRFRIKVKKQ